MSKNAINIIDQELIDLIQEYIDIDVRPNIESTKELLSMAKDLIEINAELTKREQKYKKELEHFVSGSSAIEDYNEIKKLQAENEKLKSLLENGTSKDIVWATRDELKELEALREENAELKKQSQWISVEDELPELNKTVMIDSGSGFDFARFNGDYWTRKAWPLGYAPKYWMPLPTPPEGE